MQAFVHILPAYIPTTEAAAFRAQADEQRTEARRRQPEVDHLAEHGHTEEWCRGRPVSAYMDGVAWQGYRTACALAEHYEDSARKAEAKDLRPPRADFLCFAAHDYAEALHERGYRRVSSIHPITLKERDAWRKRMSIPGDPETSPHATDEEALTAMRPVLDEVTWLKAQGASVRAQVGADLLLAAFMGSPTLAGLE